METLRPQSTLVCHESGAVLIEVLPVFLAAVLEGCEIGHRLKHRNHV